MLQYSSYNRLYQKMANESSPNLYPTINLPKQLGHHQSQNIDSGSSEHNYFKTMTYCQYLSVCKQLVHRIESLEKKLDCLESKAPSMPRKKKKIRRRARDVPRIYKCLFLNCGKEYGSQASLKNHKKIKHGIRLIRKSKKVSINKKEQESQLQQN